MDFVHDINFFLQLGRGIDSLIAEVTDAVDAGIGGGVQLKNVGRTAVVDAAAGFALVARVAVDRLETVGRLGQNACAGRFARAARTAEQIRMGEPAERSLIFQRARDVFLADHIVKPHRPPFVVKRKTHEQTLL